MPDPSTQRTRSSPDTPGAAEGIRRSHALETLTAYLQAHESLHVIDLGGINQANLDYVTGLGHRLYAEDLLRSYETFFTEAELNARLFDPRRAEEFVDHSLDFPDQSSDGALVWDALQFLPPQIASAVLERLYRVLAPESVLLAFFRPDSSGGTASPHVCRILDEKTLQIASRPIQRRFEPFNPRSIEKFFGRFHAVKFFLTRENLQEVIARR